MTIITKPVSGFKDDKPKTALYTELGNSDLPVRFTSSSGCPLSSGAARRGPDIEAAVALRRARRASILTQTCLLLAAVLALMIGFIGAMHVIKQMRGPRYYRGQCRIPYRRILEDTMVSGMVGGNFQTRGGDSPSGLKPVLDARLAGERETDELYLRPDGTLEFDYQLDLEFEEFEEFELPEISRGRYLHDFKVNKTAIIDPDGDRCFIMPLDRAEVPKPQSLYDIVRNMREGAYELDVDEVRHETRVVLPPLVTPQSGGEELGPEFGFFIRSACKGKTSYALEEVQEEEMVAEGVPAVVEVEVEEEEVMVEQPRAVVKRSVDAQESFEFAEFTGRKIVKYHIVNLADI